MSVAPWHLLCGVGLDLLLGDPRWLPHPVRGIGWLAARIEPLWRRTRLPLRIAGACFWISVVCPVAVMVQFSPSWLSVYWIWSFLALRSLELESIKVIQLLRTGDVPTARRQLATIVGRETGALDEPEIVRAVIETVAENLSDAVIAPLFWLLLGGPAGMAAYKAVNTLDSLVGYRNERYRQFGWASARLDDLANYIPARLSAVLVWNAALILRLDLWRSIRVTVRDARSQPSPNAGYPEAAFAGALRIRLGGLNFYGGVPSTKAHLGDPVRPLTADVYGQARALLYSSSFLMIVFAAAVLAW